MTESYCGPEHNCSWDVTNIPQRHLIHVSSLLMKIKKNNNNACTSHIANANNWKEQWLYNKFGKGKSSKDVSALFDSNVFYISDICRRNAPQMNAPYIISKLFKHHSSCFVIKIQIFVNVITHMGFNVINAIELFEIFLRTPIYLTETF